MSWAPGQTQSVYFGEHLVSSACRVAHSKCGASSRCGAPPELGEVWSLWAACGARRAQRGARGAAGHMRGQQRPALPGALAPGQFDRGGRSPRASFRVRPSDDGGGPAKGLVAALCASAEPPFCIRCGTSAPSSPAAERHPCVPSGRWLSGLRLASLGVGRRPRLGQSERGRLSAVDQERVRAGARRAPQPPRCRTKKRVCPGCRFSRCLCFRRRMGCRADSANGAHPSTMEG